MLPTKEEERETKSVKQNTINYFVFRLRNLSKRRKNRLLKKAKKITFLTAVRN